MFKKAKRPGAHSVVIITNKENQSEFELDRQSHFPHPLYNLGFYILPPFQITCHFGFYRYIPFIMYLDINECI
jgi:hypothetical protein